MLSGCGTVLRAGRILLLFYSPVPVKRPLSFSLLSPHSHFCSSSGPHPTLCGQHPSHHPSSSSCPSPRHQLPPSFTATSHLSLFSRSHSSLSSVSSTGGMELTEVLNLLEQLAPLSLAESWDNVGLLVEPSKPRPVKTILLTNDLTMPVMEEAEAMGCDLIITYHPLLFRPIKRLVQKDWKQRLAVKAVECGMAVYSPHTSWDSVKDGVNDWLIEGMGSGHVTVLSQALSSAPSQYKLEFNVPSRERLLIIIAELGDLESKGLLQSTAFGTEPGGFRVSVTCAGSVLTSCVERLLGYAELSQSLSVTQLQQMPMLGYGQGRLCTLDEPVTVATAVQKMKIHLGVPHLRLALGHQMTTENLVKSVAVCAGSGSSVLQGVKADLYITGEMSHHEVLEAVAQGTSVILSDHSNSEVGTDFSLPTQMAV